MAGGPRSANRLCAATRSGGGTFEDEGDVELMVDTNPIR